MKLELMKAALQHYLLSADCEEKNREDVFAALDEIAETIERYKDRKLWNDEGYLIPASLLAYMLNKTTYNDYGKRAKRHGGNCPFEYYAYDVRDKHIGFEQLTNKQLQHGYEVIRDLWQTNEECDSHNEDGTFSYD